MVKPSLNLLNPAVFFSLIWLVQIVGYLFYRNSFGSYETETWIVIFIAVSSFVFGSLLAQKTFQFKYFEKLNIVTKYSENISFVFFNKLVFYLFLVGLFIMILVTMKLADQVMLSSEVAITTFSNVRDIINYDFNNNRYFYHLFRCYHIIIAFVLFIFSFLPKIRRANLICIFSLGFASAMLTTSRLILLFYVLTIIGILFSYKKITMKQVCLSLCAFALFFFGMAVIVKKGYNAESSPIEILKWNFQVYLFSPLAAFNYYIKTATPSFDSVVMIPNSVKSILGIVGIHLEPRTNLMPFVNIPLRTNVYTYLYPAYHDGGKLLVLTVSLFLGFFHQVIFKLSQLFSNPVTIYIFSISLYPIAITFFEDAYFSSPGFSTVQLLPLVTFIFFLYSKKLWTQTRQAK